MRSRPGPAGTTGPTRSAPRSRRDRLEPPELLTYQARRPLEQPPVGGVVEPAARAGGMRQRHDDGVVPLQPLPHALAQPVDAEQPPRRQPADGDDQARAQESQLPISPEGAERLLLRRRQPVAPAAGQAPGIAARHGGAVERVVELVLVEPEPAAEGLPGAAAPRPELLPLEHARRLPEQICPLILATLEDGHRLERMAGLEAGAAGAGVALERAERPVRGAPPRHDATATNQRPEGRTRPPPSSSSSCSR